MAYGSQAGQNLLCHVGSLRHATQTVACALPQIVSVTAFDIADRVAMKAT